MPQLNIIDSHIHLWPPETSNQDGHAWMTPGMPLAKPHLLKDYCKASSQDRGTGADVNVQGVVYIETDVRYNPPNGDISDWAKGPLDEILFLRNIVEGKHDQGDDDMLLGLVPWAPMNQPTSVLEEYLTLAKDMAGPKAWPRVKGFRFLLQAITDKSEFETLVLSDHFIGNLTLLGSRGFSFDVGVDQHSGGTWQLDAMAKVIQMVQGKAEGGKQVIFIVNHLCKPNFSAQGSEFEGWCNAVSAMAQCEQTYMKLSGAFSELPTGLSSPKAIAEHMRPWVSHALKCFGSRRTMFGSDWPVCNVNGPVGERSWPVWKDVVDVLLHSPDYELTERDWRRIWSDTAKEAYRLH